MDQHKPSYIPQIGIPQKEKFKNKASIRAIYHPLTSPVMFGLIAIFFFLPFINIKCGGRVVKTYSGMDIISGDENNQDKKYGDQMIGVRQSAFHQFEMARENFKWKQQLKEDYDKFIDDAPHFEDDFSAEDDFIKMPQTLNETAQDPIKMRNATLLGFLCAICGVLASIWRKRIMMLVQILLGLVGFVSMFLLQYYVKITVPKSSGSYVFGNEYSAPIVTTEFALGYWLVLFLFLGMSVISFFRLRYSGKWQREKDENPFA